ncbi:MAG: hypothetical protein ACU837_16150 [Gammaproteobacteria bacterium]
MTIHAEKVIPPVEVPGGSGFKGYRDSIVQGLRIKARRQAPDAVQKAELKARFETVFTRKTLRHVNRLV